MKKATFRFKVNVTRRIEIENMNVGRNNGIEVRWKQAAL
jgi:hypothetical protein